MWGDDRPCPPLGIVLVILHRVHISASLTEGTAETGNLVAEKSIEKEKWPRIFQAVGPRSSEPPIRTIPRTAGLSRSNLGLSGSTSRCYVS